MRSQRQSREMIRRRNNADPWREVAGVQGDFELTTDPQDNAQDLIYVANAADGASWPDALGERLPGKSCRRSLQARWSRCGMCTRP